MMVKCKDCADLRAYFVGYAYCMGDVMVDHPHELSFTNYECGNADSENYAEVLDDPNEDVECANLKPLRLIKATE